MLLTFQFLQGVNFSDDACIHLCTYFKKQFPVIEILIVYVYKDVIKLTSKESLQMGYNLPKNKEGYLLFS